MNWLDFFASLVGSLAWPVSAAVIALIFRGQIKAVFNRLEELGYGEWKVKLNKDLREAEEVAEDLPPPPPIPALENDEVLPALPAPEDRFDELVIASPNAAILEEWLGVERQLWLIAVRLGFHQNEVKNPTRLINKIGDHPLFPSVLTSLLHEMRQIRNVAIHEGVATADDAYRFKKLSERVRPFLQTSLFDQN